MRNLLAGECHTGVQERETALSPGEPSVHILQHFVNIGDICFLPALVQGFVQLVTLWKHLGQLWQQFSQAGDSLPPNLLSAASMPSIPIH